MTLLASAPWLGTSCGKGDSPEPSGPTTADACDGGPTWDGYAKGVLTTWCTPCHARALTGTDRQGAPAGIELETLADAIQWAARIQARTVDTPSMPPGGGPSEEERERLGQWLSCGLPGTEAPPPACDDAEVRAGDVQIGSSDDARDLCASGPIEIEGSLVVTHAAVAMGCVCGVGGAIEIDGGSLQLPELTHAGPLTVRGDTTLVDLPSLGVLRGDLSVSSAPELHRLALPRLASAEGGVHIDDAPALTELALDRLSEVGGPVTLHRAGLRVVELPRLATAPALSFVDLPDLERPPVTDSLADVPGGIVLEAIGVPDLSQGLDSLVHATGDLVLRDLPTVSLEALRPLRTIQGDLVLESLPELVDGSGLVDLEEVRGDVIVRGAPGVPLSAWERWSDGIDIGGTLVLEPETTP